MKEIMGTSKDYIYHARVMETGDTLLENWYQLTTSQHCLCTAYIDLMSRSNV